jgi:serine/threonine protein kinase
MKKNAANIVRCACSLLRLRKRKGKVEMKEPVQYKNYKAVKTLSPISWMAFDDKEDGKIIKHLDIPHNASHMFDLLAQNLGLDEIEEFYKEKAHVLRDQLERLSYLEEDAKINKPVEFILQKHPSKTGWQIKILKEAYMPLSVYQKYHSFQKEEVIDLSLQVLSALSSGLKAGMVHGHLVPENILLKEEQSFLVDDFVGSHALSSINPVTASIYDAKEKSKDTRSDLYSLSKIVLEIIEKNDLASQFHQPLLDIFYKGASEDISLRYEEPWLMKEAIEKEIH